MSTIKYKGRKIDGSKEYICERICKTYIETGRTIRSLAEYYGISKSMVGKYLKDYAQDLVPHDLYRKVRARAKQNMSEVYELGCSENRYSDEHGSMD